MKLAALCSQAVDYPKNGVPVDMYDRFSMPPVCVTDNAIAMTLLAG